ncbi:MAG TPA: polysaccharide deacetylase family protein [Blastocatellia bacterium]|nr:polysaccharide deacetylase family protein [Blastocatellia bacterium]
MSKREMAARVLGNTLTRKLWAWAGAGARALRILAYHRVLDADPQSFAFDEDLISATTDGFRQQMQFARRNFDVVSFQDLYACDLECRPWPERALVVTFDDGFRDNYTNAFPILKALGLPATIFLATGHVGRSKLLWSDAIAYCFKRTSVREVTLREVARQSLPLLSAGERKAAIECVLRWIKQAPEDTKRAFLGELSTRLNVEVDDSLAEGMHLTWEDARTMAADQIEFGSHSVSHPILANVDPARLEDELRESKRTIEEHLGREVIALAYPVGGPSAYNRRVQEAAAICGYKYAMSYEEGVAAAGACDPFAMPRIHVERDHSLDLFCANLMFPQVMLRNRQPRREDREVMALPPPAPAS